jgi:argininosuccinate lyase
MADNQQDIVTIDGKDYELSKLPLDIRNTIVARQEIQRSKIRHEIELEKIEVLTNHYNEKIKKGLEQLNGGDSKSKD